MREQYQYGFLKWPGGKNKCLSRLFRTIPREGQRLVELFVGSAAFSLNTDYDEYVLADWNGDLILLYQHIVHNLDEVKSKSLYLILNKNNEVDYYRLRDLFNAQTIQGVDRAAMFLYFCRVGFKGLVRYSKKTGYNVPFGGYKQPYFPEDEMDFFAGKFKDATILHANFTDAFEKTNPSINDVYYLDPPYVNLNDTRSFVHYTADGFKREQHLELDLLSMKARKNGAQVYLSNHDSKELDDLYLHYSTKKRFRVGRSISAKAKKHKKAPEVLLLY